MQKNIFFTKGQDKNKGGKMCLKLNINAEKIIASLKMTRF